MPELVAVVDLGSTAVRLLLARIVPGAGYRVLVEERVATRLGGGPPGRLPGAAIDDTLRAVHRFFARHTSKGQGPRIVAVATSAVRDATNRERLLGPLRRLEGVEVQVLSARDEARLGVDAALNRLRFKSGIVADLGGASLQLSRVRRRKVASITSLPLGAVRTTRRFLRHDPPRPRELRALRHEVRRHLDGAMPPAGRRDVLVALGGTVRTLASIHLRAHPGERKHRNGLQLWQSDITAIRERLEGLSPRKHRKIRGLTAERADVILAGAIVIEEVMVFGGYLTLAVCSSGVRDGVLLREADGVRRYCHVATGNYNVRTGGVYGDLGLFTSRESFGEDLTALFNLLTGYTEPPGFRHLLLAPTDLRDGLVERIRREADHARAGRHARIVAKMNGLADRRMIEELYAASEAGVSIDLIVRGICCLRPGVPGLSENIRAISIVDRYLEHARIFHFENAGDAEYLLASADWMPRNLDRRVEIAFPVLDPGLKSQIREILATQLADTVKARRILADGRSVRIRPAGHAALRSQERLYETMGAGGIVA